MLDVFKKFICSRTFRIAGPNAGFFIAWIFISYFLIPTAIIPLKDNNSFQIQMDKGWCTVGFYSNNKNSYEWDFFCKSRNEYEEMTKMLSMFSPKPIELDDLIKHNWGYKESVLNHKDMVFYSESFSFQLWVIPAAILLISMAIWRKLESKNGRCHVEQSETS